MRDIVGELYRLRFKRELESRNKIWEVLCKNFFQKFIRRSYTVCDLGAGYCEFINNIKAENKYAVDLNPETRRYARKGIKTVITSSTQLPKNLENKFDVVFASNFFEHLASKEELTKTLLEIKRVLKKGGQIIILMPNLRYVGAAYWDFLDHQLPLTEKSMVEALELHGFEINYLKIKFLPYSTKGNLPKHPLLVSIYLKFPLIHYFLGKQSLIVGQKIK